MAADPYDPTDQAEPVVQIVHYSDIHLASADHVAQRRGLASMQAYMSERWRQGLASADRAALRSFIRFLRSEIAADPRWRGHPTWLVDTGDGTTFGDLESLEEWIGEWSPLFREAAGPAAEQLILYGNHDAWPGAFPLRRPNSMEQQRDLLRHRWFSSAWPERPLTALVPGSTARVELYAVNTVDHRLFACALAWGAAAPDRHWERSPPMAGPTPADDVARLAAAQAGSEVDPVFRIVATHFPVSDAAQAGHRTAQLCNRAPFAEALDTRQTVGRPMVQMLLCGHAHQTRPVRGDLPSTAAGSRHPPLADGTCEIQSASLSQSRVAARRMGRKDPFRNQATILRIYKSASAPLRLEVQRHVIGRAAAGPFLFLPCDQAGSAFETMTVPLLPPAPWPS